MDRIKNKFVFSIMILCIGIVMLAFMLYFFQINEKDNENNAYFFPENETQVKYDGVIYPLSSREIKQDITLSITEIQKLENGTLFKLELEQPPVEEPLDQIRMGARYLGYFYVTKDTIYLKPLGDMEGYSEEKDNKIVEAIRANEKLFLEDCYIVCSENETNDEPDENGWYSYVEAVGERRFFYLYNSYTSGTKEYCEIVWQKGAGIVYYLHGSGNRLMEVELYKMVED